MDLFSLLALNLFHRENQMERLGGEESDSAPQHYGTQSVMSWRLKRWQRIRKSSLWEVASCVFTVLIQVLLLLLAFLGNVEASWLTSCYGETCWLHGCVQWMSNIQENSKSLEWYCFCLALRRKSGRVWGGGRQKSGEWLEKRGAVKVQKGEKGRVNRIHMNDIFVILGLG